MGSHVNYTLVGAFVLVLLTFIVLSIMWLSSGISIEQYSTYKVYMNESVYGLNRDASVSYNGVNVGTVRSINIDYQHPEWVELLLNIKKGTPITQGTRAKLDVKSLSGIASIELEDKGKDLTLLKAEKGEKYPVIPTVPSLLVRLEGMLMKFGDNFNQVRESIQALLSKENIQLMQQTLVAGRNALNSGQNTVRSIETQIIPDTNRAIKSFDEMTRDISALSIEIKNNPSVLIRGKQPTVLGPGER